MANYLHNMSDSIIVETEYGNVVIPKNIHGHYEHIETGFIFRNKKVWGRRRLDRVFNLRSQDIAKIKEYGFEIYKSPESVLENIFQEKGLKYLQSLSPIEGTDMYVFSNYQFDRDMLQNFLGNKLIIPCFMEIKSLGDKYNHNKEELTNALQYHKNKIDAINSKADADLLVLRKQYQKDRLTVEKKANAEIIKIVRDLEIVKTKLNILNQAVTGIPKSIQCSICCVNDVNCVISPCDHFGFCRSCIDQCLTCPTCRVPITAKKNVFVV